MHRLLQGDVGAGKTVVAVAALLAAVQGGHQGAFMAPTEVLAEQHHSSIRPLVDGISVPDDGASLFGERPLTRSEEHTSELQSLMRISYAVFCLKKKKHIINQKKIITQKY